MCRHLEGKEPSALYPIDAEAFQLMLVVEEAQSVAIGESGNTRHGERIATQLLDVSDHLAQCLRCVKRGNIGLTAMEEISGEAAVECLLQVGREPIAHLSEGSPAVIVGAAPHQIIKFPTVSTDHILDIVSRLQPSFNLERADTGIGQFLKMVEAVHILQRQQMAVMLYRMPVSVEQIELHTAKLSTSTPVGRTAEAVLRGVADTGIAHTERAMDKALQLDSGYCLVYGLDLIQ